MRHLPGRQVGKILAATLLALLLATSAVPVGAVEMGLRFGNSKFFSPPRMALCMTDYQVRQAMAKAGYTNVTLNVANDDHIQVRAVLGGSLYLIKFNRCRGVIENWLRLR